MDKFLKYMMVFLLGFVLGPPLITHFSLMFFQNEDEDQNVIQVREEISFTCKWFNYKCYSEEN